MDFLESRREAAERLQRYADAQGTDLGPFRNEHDVFSHRQRWIDFWLEGATLGYHLCGEIRKLPSQLAGSQASFRGVWDEAGSVHDLPQAFELLRSWLIDAKEVDELKGRIIHRSMLNAWEIGTVMVKNRATRPNPGEEPPATYAASLRFQKPAHRLRLQTWPYPLVLGQPLPTLPLWLSADRSVPLNLEASYEDTCRLLRIA